MTNIDLALLCIAIGSCVAVIARAGDSRIWALIAGLCVLAVLIGWV